MARAAQDYADLIGPFAAADKEFPCEVGITMLLCLVKGFVWHFPGLISGVLKDGERDIFAGLRTRQGRSTRVRGKLLLGHAQQGRDPGTADESLAGQHGCGSRFEGQAVPGEWALAG